MVQGIMSGWIFILIMVTLYADENLRHVMPAVFAAFLVLIVVATPVWLSMVLPNYDKRKKTKKQAVEIEVVD
jgi:membrane-bound acyltransferase YfiQ involved in biofilm formation